MKTMKKILLWFLVIAILFLATLWFYSVYINLTVWDSSPYGVLVVANYPDGKILIWRRFTYGFNEHLLMRLNPDGTVDNTFKIGEWFWGHKEDYDKFIGISAILIQDDNKIVIGGYFGEYNWEAARNIIRLNPDGSRDITFDTGTWFDGVGNWRVNDIALQGEKILIWGHFSNYNSEDVDWIVRLNHNGSLDKSFLWLRNTKLTGWIQSLVVLPDGSIIAWWYLSEYNEDGFNQIWLVKFTSEWKFDLNFAKNWLDWSYGSVNSVLLLQDGGLLAGGQFRNYGWVKANWIVRLMSNGFIDRSFNKNGNWFDLSDDNENHVSTIEPLPNGEIIVGWVFTRYNGEQVGNIVVLDSEGNIDSTAKISHFDYEVRDIHLTNENVWIGGDFFKYWFKNAVGLIKIPLKSFE